MIDNQIPTNQFHPYQPVEATPQRHATAGGMKGMLEKSGLGSILNDTNVRRTLDRARSYARSNSSMVLGGLAAAVIGAGLLSSRGMRGSSRRS
jgi:hypothetical protein